MDREQWLTRFKRNFEWVNHLFAKVTDHGHVFEELMLPWEPSARSRGGPGPQSNVHALLNHAFAGGDVAGLLDRVGYSRVQAALADQSLDLYRRYLHTICAFAAIFDWDVAPAGPTLVHRLCSAIDNDSTLRGFLSALNF